MTYDIGGNVQRVFDEQKEKLKEFDERLVEARLVSRDVIYKIILICSSIIGFSLTLISLPNLEFRVDIGLLKISWYLFLTTIILGFFSIFLEGRLHYALNWRAFQVQSFDKKYKYPFRDKLKVWSVCLYSLFFPRNLIFCMTYKSEKDNKYNYLLNAKAVQTLADLEKVPFILENLFILSFISALVIFVVSYT